MIVGALCHGWFSANFTVAMLVDKNKSVLSLLLGDHRYIEEKK